MLRNISQKYRMFLKYSRYYLVVSIFIFMITKDDLIENFGEKLFLILGILLFYILIYSFIGYYMRMKKSVNKDRWDEVKKIADLQLNFFLFFGIFSLASVLYSLFTFPEFAPFLLLISNVAIGVVIGALKSKCIYIYENDTGENKGINE